MTRPGPAPERADTWISRVVAATVVGLAAIAGAISYSHISASSPPRTVTLAGTLTPSPCPSTESSPLSVDGVEIVASLVLLADRRAARRSGWLPWAALTIGTAASLAANIATDHGTRPRVTPRA